MQSKPIVYGLAGVWVVVFVISFIVVLAVAPEDDSYAQRLGRIASFLTWQLAGLIVGVVSAFVTQRAVARGVDGVRLPGYGPLAISAFVLVSFIGIVAYRVWLQPLLAAWFGLA
jgi:hypothetical protein